MGYSTSNKTLEAGTSTSSTYFQPTNIRHKYVCPGSSRYSRHRRRCLFNNNNEKDDSSIVKVLPSQSKCPPLSVRRNISLLHLLFCLLIFLVILPAVRCMESQSFVEPKIGWLARTLSSVVAAVTGASIAGQPSAVEPSSFVETIDNSIPPSLADNSSNSSMNHPTPRTPKRRRRAIAIEYDASVAGCNYSVSCVPSAYPLCSWRHCFWLGHGRYAFWALRRGICFGFSSRQN